MEAGSAPTKVCRRCGASNITNEAKCPNCGKKYKQRSVVKILLGLFLLGCLFIVGCAVLIGTAANNAVNELNAEQEAHAITKKTYNSIDLGDTEAQVIRKAGKKPENRQE